MNLKKQMDAIYREFALDDIPWNVETPPNDLTDLIESRWILPCDAADLGCGVGNYTLWLASKGFTMTGLDLSPQAIELASDRAEQKNFKCRFITRDMTENQMDLDKAFDFAFDWEVLHHVFPEVRGAYIKNVHRMLRSKGKYFSVCFSEEEPHSFGGSGKYRKTPLGTTLYFSSEEELKQLFEPLFIVEQLRTVEVLGKKGNHVAIKAMMVKKDV